MTRASRSSPMIRRRQWMAAAPIGSINHYHHKIQDSQTPTPLCRMQLQEGWVQADELSTKRPIVIEREECYDDFDDDVSVVLSSTNILHSHKCHNVKNPTPDMIVTMAEAKRRHARFPRYVKGCCRKYLAEEWRG